MYLPSLNMPIFIINYEIILLILKPHFAPFIYYKMPTCYKPKQHMPTSKRKNIQISFFFKQMEP
jgi:hypothetical protein